MAIATTLEQYLADKKVAFEIVTHPPTPSSSRTAQAAHVPGERVAKSVVLHDSEGYVLVVVPATHRVELDAIQGLLDRRLSLATESEISNLFGDCDLGAIPPVGAAYGLDVILDESLGGQPDVYFEAGDHISLIHVEADQFEGLMGDARRGRISHHI